jgi:hypothetical protein
MSIASPPAVNCFIFIFNPALTNSYSYWLIARVYEQSDGS